MRAVLFDAPGGPERLYLGEAADPVPAPGETLVAVEAFGLNRADLLQRMGRYPAPPGASPILGLELAGRVVEPAAGGRFAAGDRVMAVVTGGAYAEHAAVPDDLLLPVPEGLRWEEAAAIPEAFLTAWLNLVTLGRLAPGETVLVHAGASGVGSAAIQIASQLFEARVLATAGSAEKLAFCRVLGADAAWSRHEGDFAPRVLDAAPHGVDLVLDFVGAPYWAGNLEVLKRGGRLTLIGFLGGARGDLDLGPVMRKSLTVTGTTLRATPLAQKVALVREFAAHALPRFADRTLRPAVDRVHPWEETAEAHRAMAENRNAGKIVLRVGG